MRVLQACPYSWSRPGGVREHVAGLSAALAARGHEVEILAPDGGGAVEGVPVRSAGRSVPILENGSVVRVALGPAALGRALRVALRGRYDVVHVHEPLIPAVSLVPALAATAPVVGTFHMYSTRRRWYRPFAPLARRAVPRLAARIAVSDAARRHVARTVPGDYVVVPNGVDVASFALDEERTADRLVFVGRAEPRKGLGVLLDALRRLPAEVHLDLAGVSAGELPAHLPGEVAARVHPLGVVSEAERRRLLGRAAVLCVPSLEGESFGLVVVEGMAAGAPVVASDLPGYSLVLPERAGRLVPPGDPAALAATLGELLADDGLRAALGRAGEAEARRYDWSRVADRVLDVYRSVTER